MTWDNVAWAVGGGAEHKPEIARLLAYAATGGTEGIVTPGDLKVVPLAVPGAGVRVLAGAALILNRSPGGGQQTYVARNPTEDTITGITGTTSAGGRSDLIVARIRDPQYPGTDLGGADPKTFQYVTTERISNVPGSTTSATQLNLAYPAIALARIDYPLSTSTITAAMIIDLRKLAQPREHREMLMQAVSTSDLTPTAYGNWGNWYPTVDVPSWATHVAVRAEVGGAVSQNGPVTGYLRVAIGELYGEGRGYDIDAVGAVREDFVMLAGGDIRAVAGTAQTLRIQGYRTMAGGEVGYLRTLDQTTHFGFDVQFYERAV